MNTILLTVTFQVPDEAKELLHTAKKNFPQVKDIQVTLVEPHVTLYQCKIQESMLREALDTLAKIAEETAPICFEANGVNSKNEYIGISYKKTEEIVQVHKIVVEQLNIIRGDLLRSVYVEKRDSYTPSEQQLIDIYGYPYVFDEYHPHVAMITLKDKTSMQEVIRAKMPMVDFVSSGFEVVILDTEGKNTHFIKFIK